MILPVGGPAASMVALDADSGATVWASGKAPASYCSAMPITFRGRGRWSRFCKTSWPASICKPAGCSGGSRIPEATTNTPPSPLYDEPYLRTMQPFRAGSDLYMFEESPRGDDSSERLGLPAQAGSARPADVERRCLQRAGRRLCLRV